MIASSSAPLLSVREKLCICSSHASGSDPVDPLLMLCFLAASKSAHAGGGVSHTRKRRRGDNGDELDVQRRAQQAEDEELARRCGLLDAEKQPTFA